MRISDWSSDVCSSDLSWTTIRLELARTPAFPNGSAARSYVLRLPLGSGGLIDEREYRIHPELATARRFWTNEPDRHGTLLHTGNGWALSYEQGGADDEKIYRRDCTDQNGREQGRGGG